MRTEQAESVVYVRYYAMILSCIGLEKDCTVQVVQDVFLEELLVNAVETVKVDHGFVLRCGSRRCRFPYNSRLAS